MLTLSERMDKYMLSADDKFESKWHKVLLLGILAGAFIALGGVGYTIAHDALPSGWDTVVSALIFSFGLVMVVISGSELFTGDCLLIAPLLAKRVTWKKAATFLCLVYVANLAGALLVAVFTVYGGVLTVVSETAVNIALNKSSLGFLSALLKGFMCNVLVCVAVWMASSTDKVGAKVACCIIPITLFVLCGFEHSVANMYYLPAGLMINALQEAPVELSFGNMILYNMFPVTIGNILGGFAVGATYFFVSKK